MTREHPSTRNPNIPNDPGTTYLNKQIAQDRREDAMIERHRQVCRNPRCACGAWTGPEPEPEPISDRPLDSMTLTRSLELSGGN